MALISETVESESNLQRARFIAAPPADAWDRVLQVGIVVSLAVVLWFAMGALLLSFRTLMWFRYRPFDGASMQEAPTMTVVIPAFNEGPVVAKAIDSVAAARYPHDRLEIIAIDDGSTDDTWQHIQQAAARHGGRVKTLQQPQNQGKREALGVVFRQSRSDVLVTVDSDSVVEADALLALAGPFRDARIEVVAGRVLVYNRHEGLIPRMLQVRFLLALDFLRAYQSTFGTVHCSPGAPLQQAVQDVPALGAQFFPRRTAFCRHRVAPALVCSAVCAVRHVHHQPALPGAVWVHPAGVPDAVRRSAGAAADGLVAGIDVPAVFAAFPAQ